MLVAGIEPALQPKAVAQARVELDRIVAIVLLAAEGLQWVGDVRPQDQVPVRAPQHLLDLGRGHPGRVRAPDEGARAGSRDRVDRDAVLLQPLQDARVRDPFGRAAAERQPHARTPCRLLAAGRDGRQREQQDRECDGHRPHDAAWPMQPTPGTAERPSRRRIATVGRRGG